MPSGYNGKILHVDLTRGQWAIEEPGEKFFQRYLGGSAMGTVYVMRETPAGADPLSTDNVLTFFIGITTGAPISGTSRISANAKSPLTGAIADAQAGGFLPAELKAAGFEGIVLKGRSPRPVYLWIHDGAVELRDAQRLWGRVTGDVEEELRRDLGDPKVQVLQIGPAGEKLCRFASVVNMSNRANGRTGLGAVMGSKNLKAIAVRGTHLPRLYDLASVVEFAKSGVQRFPTSGVAHLKEYGTGATIGGNQRAGGLPTRNWNSGSFEAWKNIDGITLKKSVLKGNDTCFGCIIRCKRVVEIREGPFQAAPRYGGPEYETLAALGSYCGVDNLAAICKANELCNQYGVDTISCGATIAWAMECFEKSILAIDDTDGIALTFGNAQAMVTLTEKICRREGIGDLLAEGSLRAAQKIGKGSEALLLHAKGLEFPAHMPQVKGSLALIYAVNPYGADHQSHEHDTAYRPGLSEERWASLGLLDPQADAAALNAEKVKMALYSQWAYNLDNSLCLCQFVWGPAWHLYGTDEIPALVHGVTGWNTSLWELMKAGERTVNLQRAFNAREGVLSNQDTLPSKMFQRLAGGPSDGWTVNQSHFRDARAQYYRMAGWTEEGKPTRGKLEELDLGWAADLMSA